MIGPYKQGEHASLPEPSSLDWESGRLIRNNKYAVVQAFTDFDGSLHCAGECWVFLGTLFSKFEDRLTICVKKEDGTEWRIPLCWKRVQQESIIEEFVPHYVLPVDESNRGQAIHKTSTTNRWP